MSEDLDVNDVAAALRESIGLLLRRLRQAPAEGEVTLPESAALTRLHRGGPATSTALAKLEQISPQSMGATLAALEARGLVERHPDPDDGRRVVLSITALGGNSCTTNATRGPNGWRRRSPRVSHLRRSGTEGGRATARTAGAEHLMPTPGQNPEHTR